MKNSWSWIGWQILSNVYPSCLSPSLVKLNERHNNSLSISIASRWTKRHSTHLLQCSKRYVVSDSLVLWGQICHTAPEVPLHDCSSFGKAISTNTLTASDMSQWSLVAELPGSMHGSISSIWPDAMYIFGPYSVAIIEEAISHKYTNRPGPFSTYQIRW